MSLIKPDETIDAEYNLVDKALLDLFTSRVRIKILNIFVPRPDEMFYVREVTRMVNEEVNAVRRELERLKAIGFLTTEQRANRLYYKVKIDFPFYYEILRIIGKTTGLAHIIHTQFDKTERIKFLTLSASFVQRKTSQPNEIDMLIVGKLNLEKLQEVIRRYEQQIKREINYSVMTEDEFDFRKKRGDAFIRSVLSQLQIVVIGDEHQLYQ